MILKLRSFLCAKCGKLDLHLETGPKCVHVRCHTCGDDVVIDNSEIDNITIVKVKEIYNQKRSSM